MSFRYHDQAYRLDDSLEEVMETHRPEKQAAESETDTAESALRRVKKPSPVEVVRSVIEQKKKKSAAELIAEHDLRESIRESASQQQSHLDSFLESVKNAR